ncbi:MerR family transcriptional regulator [Halalkalibacterium ligniniphilum]|uniref:MerR family transcriptional regulator n=1 Tax=Halalkalibacterium ligniniphilum TaxID=1134413 RepID=UPI0003491156|nr:MerR family transcriptional regulator [Halalkalibacterium ligniniphilum]
MVQKVYTVKEFARMTGVTERTLRYYDRQGVLTPSSYTDNGYRLYNLDDLYKMQKILTMKFLGFSLKEIIQHLSEDTSSCVRQTLNNQKQLLKEKRDEIDFVIRTITKVEEVIQDEKVDSNLILTIIHSIQHEKMQKQWLAKHVSQPTLDQMFWQHVPDNAKVAIEREGLLIIKKLQTFFEQGLSPHEEQVQQSINILIGLLNDLIEPQYMKEIEKIELEDEMLFQFSFVSKEFQKFLEVAIERFNEVKEG